MQDRYVRIAGKKLVVEARSGQLLQPNRLTSILLTLKA